MKETRT